MVDGVITIDSMYKGGGEGGSEGRSTWAINNYGIVKALTHYFENTEEGGWYRWYAIKMSRGMSWEWEDTSRD